MGVWGAWEQSLSLGVLGYVHRRLLALKSPWKQLWPLLQDESHLINPLI